VLLPYDAANRFVRALAEYRGARASWTAWVAPRTLKPAEAARLTGMSEGELRRINLIPPRMLVKLGSTLLVPRPAQRTQDVAEHIAENAVMNLAPEGRPLRELRLEAGRQGDSVAAVARRYRVSAALVAQWNDVPAQARFKPGQSIVVMVPAAKRVAKAAPATHRVAKTATPRKRATPVRVAQGTTGAGPSAR
jgi:membrane-bound lytic murein transglycosylase D